MNAITIPNAAQVEKFKTLQIVVNSPETETQARSYLTDVRLAGKRLDQDVKALKRPHQDAIKDIDEAARPLKTILAERDQSLERALLDYSRQVRLAVEEANRKAMEKYEKKVDKVEAKAIMENKPMPIVLPPQLASAPQKSVEADGAKQTVVKRKAWRLDNPLRNYDPSQLTAASAMQEASAIPLEYFILDTARIGKVVRAGGSIPGIEVYEEESISVRA